MTNAVDAVVKNGLYQMANRNKWILANYTGKIRAGSVEVWQVMNAAHENKVVTYHVY